VLVVFTPTVSTAPPRLEAHPGSGRRIPEFPELPHREIIVRPYRFFYRVEKHVAWVVAAWHGAQLAEEP
jgi:plasmid stabilization system protein ParE